MSKKSLASLIFAGVLCPVLPAQSQSLPDGPGKETVAAYCESCHTFFSRVGSGYTPEGWRTVIRMMANHGVVVPPDQLAVMTDYLTKHFPEKSKPAGVATPGPAKVAIKVWPVPTPGSRPHDPLATKDGAIWYSGQMANVLGRLDPKTSEVKLVTAPTPKSRPYGIQVNSKGVPFTVLFGTNKVASIDPKTMAIKEYTLPDAGARPRRLALTSDDVIWYTDNVRGYLGRLDPATGQAKEWLSPGGPQSEPYGISVIKDIVWYSESGTTPNTVVRFDPKTEKFQTWVIPGGGNIVRNTDVTRDGNFVLANSLVNAVTLVEIDK